MAEERLALEMEVQAIFQHIDRKKNFILSGGAGSGKTYSLVQVITQALAEDPTERVACITYTNAAVKEIESRIQSDNLKVTTIHQFFWENISLYQIELKTILIELINNNTFGTLEEEITSDYFNDKEIQYKEYTKIKEGIISHDEILKVANKMFENYSKLCDIVKDKFKYIFVDEYQDTNKEVIDIFLVHLKKSKKKNIIGFFGDAMQSIYDSGVGDLNTYISSGEIQEVKKEQNRRNPRLVIELANRLRTDGITQIPSEDLSAPNMREDGTVKDGKINFYFSTGEENLDTLKEILGWDFSDSKELNLTHNLIAPKAGFQELMNIYDGDKILSYKDRVIKYIKKNDVQTNFESFTMGEVIDHLLLDKDKDSERKPILPTNSMLEFIENHQDLYNQAMDYPFEVFKKIYLDKELLLDDKKEESNEELKTGSKRDDLINHLYKIQETISLFEKGLYNEFLRKTQFKVTSIADKIHIKDTIRHLQNMTDNSIEEVINFADRSGIYMADDKLNSYKEKQQYVYRRVKEVRFQEFQNLYNYLEGYTPFTTQHKIKGSEFNNVLVVLDNGNWSKYNFEYLLDDNIFDSLSPTKKANYGPILDRTRKLFYVCCTRSKENLVVYYHNPTRSIIEKAKAWFGESNVNEI